MKATISVGPNAVRTNCISDVARAIGARNLPDVVFVPENQEDRTLSCAASAAACDLDRIVSDTFVVGIRLAVVADVLEAADLLGDAFFLELEIARRQRRYRLALLVEDGDVDADEVGAGAEDGLGGCWGVGERALGRVLRRGLAGGGLRRRLLPGGATAADRDRAAERRRRHVTASPGLTMCLTRRQRRKKAMDDLKSVGDIVAWSRNETGLKILTTACSDHVAQAESDRDSRLKQVPAGCANTRRA